MNFIPDVSQALRLASSHLVDSIRVLAFVAKDESASHKVRIDASSKLLWAFGQLRESREFQSKLDTICDEIETSRSTIQQLERELEIERDKRSKLEQRR